MNFTFDVEPATFLERPNRYVIHARLHGSGEIVRAHCPDPGRLQELLIPGAVVHLDQAGVLTRRTTHTLRFVEHPESGQLVSLNTQLPNAVFREGWESGFFPQFHGYTAMRSEVSLPAGPEGVVSRLDFRLSNEDGGVCWVEVKSASLVIDGVARFPDAPTLRGRRHVDELVERIHAGEDAAVIFIVQRPDAVRFSPFTERDPEFAAALARAADNGVSIYAYTCDLTTRSIQLAKEIPVVLRD
ncbi:MAG: DNA/RNA nuclease SfsA [Caldilineaceae bacterium]|nr:DNA/RNA nuclease SfsA [Caldilineaceae bacterium]